MGCGWYAHSEGYQRVMFAANVVNVPLVHLFRKSIYNFRASAAIYTIWYAHLSLSLNCGGENAPRSDRYPSELVSPSPNVAACATKCVESNLQVLHAAEVCVVHTCAARVLPAIKRQGNHRWLRQTKGRCMRTSREYKKLPLRATEQQHCGASDSCSRASDSWTYFISVTQGDIYSSVTREN
jgi:hypothetical protein